MQSTDRALGLQGGGTGLLKTHSPARPWWRQSIACFKSNFRAVAAERFYSWRLRICRICAMRSHRAGHAL